MGAGVGAGVSAGVGAGAGAAGAARLLGGATVSSASLSASVRRRFGAIAASSRLQRACPGVKIEAAATQGLAPARVPTYFLWNLGGRGRE